ncbi:TPA: DEAD/DEAH box helicase [Escherichia coli]|nr:DEAD/DEAH box helicase [Escherichia coli]HCP6561750.1 DEAD/DEAH box helicase [Escherichia coli]HCP6574965.1 DEAD/DEAH box helicase [Escherichia coli]HCP6606296.1 DEAD/DEAH box helicase [Escherichia coli]HCP6615273.1 DEAD/DEAH box helicase [Escherichia coli]
MQRSYLVNTLAAEIISQIKKHLEFKNDLSFLFAHSFLQNHKRTSFATKQSKIGDENIVIYKRLIESAYLFSQSESDEDKNLAQSIAYHLNVVTGDDYLKQMSENLLRVLGNFPGATYLQQENGFIPESFYAFLKISFIENENKIKISNKEITLTNFQKRVWESLHSNVPQAISAPTSAGKSFLVVEMLANGIISGELNSAIYIAPTRALVNEITQKFIIKTLPYQNEVRVTSIPTINNEYNKQIFVLTQERLQVLLDNFEEKIDLVVIDEAQSISDEIRGMILQDCLDKISTQNPNAKYVFLAPGAEGFDDLADIIGIDAIHIEKTNLSPVVQNKIIVKVDPSKENNLRLSLLDNSDILPIGEIESTRGFANENTRLAAVALELGKNEGSLVYGTGAENAEDVAKQISSGLPLLEDDSELQELSKFIKKHVHEDYSLANLVLRGVGYHYGKMPSLLRETLEKNFTNNKLKFLVCTTTLFQGVNLPAKNVFIDTPTRGNRGEKLDPASLWNFAGRAGRLGYAFSGNVYLIDYDDWVTKPLDSKIDFKITSSLKKVINEDFDTVISRLDKNNHSGVTPYSNIDAAAGLLISRAAKGDLHNFLKRSFRTLSDKSKLETIDNATYISLESLKIPHEVLTLNWTVDPFGQERLYNRFIQKIKEGKVDELIPRHPSGDVYKNYVGVFSRINKYILNHNTSKFSNYLTSIALNWMRGKSLPEIISLSINKKKEKNPLGL